MNKSILYNITLLIMSFKSVSNIPSLYLLSKQHLMTGKMKDTRTLGKTIDNEIDIVFYGEKRLF